MKRIPFICNGIFILSFAALCFLSPNMCKSKGDAKDINSKSNKNKEILINKRIDEKLLNNSTYDLGGFGGKIKLINGVYKDPIAGYAEIAKILYGNLNDDNKEDAIVLLKQSGGGSGTWTFLLAVINYGEKFDFLQGIDLGDRNIIESIKIDNGVIILNMVVHDKDDPSCCPSAKVIKKFKVVSKLTQL